MFEACIDQIAEFGGQGGRKRMNIEQGLILELFVFANTASKGTTFKKQELRL